MTDTTFHIIWVRFVKVSIWWVKDQILLMAATRVVIDAFEVFVVSVHTFLCTGHLMMKAFCCKSESMSKWKKIIMLAAILSPISKVIVILCHWATA